MKVIEEQADALAAETVEAMEKLGDMRLFEEIAKSLGSSSQTAEEAFLTSVRVRLAVRRARGVLAERLAQSDAKAD